MLLDAPDTDRWLEFSREFGETEPYERDSGEGDVASAAVGDGGAGEMSLRLIRPTGGKALVPGREAGGDTWDAGDARKLRGERLGDW